MNSQYKCGNYQCAIEPPPKINTQHYLFLFYLRYWVKKWNIIQTQNLLLEAVRLDSNNSGTSELFNLKKMVKMKAKNLIAMGILIALIAFINACKNPSTQVNDKFVGKWHEKTLLVGSGDTVVFFSNGNLASKLNSTFKSYSLITADTLEIKGTAFSDNHKSKYVFYSDTVVHISSFGSNLIGTGYDSIILLKN